MPSYSDIVTAFNDNCAPFRSLDQVERFITAVTQLIAQPNQQGTRSGTTMFDRKLLMTLREEAVSAQQRFIAASGTSDPAGGSTTARVIYPDFTNSR